MGYPILRRSHKETGLETRFTKMMELADVNSTNTFCGRYLIKGFSTMLVPNRCQDGFLYWRHISNEDGSHITYSDPRARDIFQNYPTGMSLDFMLSVRHIIGPAPGPGFIFDVPAMCSSYVDDPSENDSELTHVEISSLAVELSQASESDELPYMIWDDQAGDIVPREKEIPRSRKKRRASCLASFCGF